MLKKEGDSFMDDLTKKIIESKDNNLILQVSSQDLKEIVAEVVTNLLKDNTDDEYLTTEEVCRMIKVEQNSLTRYTKQRILNPSKTFGKNLYSKKEILKAMEEGRI